MESTDKDFLSSIEKLGEICPKNEFIKDFFTALSYAFPAKYFILLDENHLLKELDLVVYESVNKKIHLLIQNYLKKDIEYYLENYFYIKVSEKLSMKNFEDNKLLKISTKNLNFCAILASPLFICNKKEGWLIMLNDKKFDKLTGEKKEKLLLLSKILALHLENNKLKEENKRNERLSLLGQSIINSAHGLKNLLNNIDGGVYIVEKGTLKKNMDEVSKGWEILRRNSNRVRDLVLDILLFSRPKKPDYKKCNINDICKDIKELLEQKNKKTNLELCLHLDPDIGDFILDPKGIYRAVLNLVSNAIHACEEKKGGRVTIKTSMKDVLEIEVSDTGTGISKENLDNIFDTFFTTKGTMGTGLGLSVTKKIISEHNGTIDVKSLLNVGTTFTIKLPINNPALQ